MLKKGIFKDMTTFHWLLVSVGLAGLWAFSISLKRRKTVVTLNTDDMSRADKIEFIMKNNGADIIIDDAGASGFDGYGNQSVVFDVMRRDYVPLIDHKEDGYVLHMFSSADGSDSAKSTQLGTDEEGSLNGEQLTEDLIDMRSNFDKMTDDEINQAFEVVRYRLLNRKQKLSLNDIVKDLRWDARRRLKAVKKIIPSLKKVKEVNKVAKAGIKENRRVFRKGSQKSKLKNLKFPDTEEGARAKKLVKEKFNIEGEIKDLLWLLKRKGYDYTIRGNKETGLRVVSLGEFTTGAGISTKTTPQQDVNRINDLFLEHRLVRLELIDLGYGKMIARGNQGYGKGDVKLQGKNREDKDKLLVLRTRKGRSKDRKGKNGFDPSSLSKLFR